DLPGLEVPLIENSQPPYQRDNIKYETGEDTVTTLNLLDWEGESPLAHSSGWMFVDPGRLDENGDGVIDDGWKKVDDGSGSLLGAGDAMPTGPILSAITPNGMNLTHNAFDTAVYLKGDRQDSTQLYDMQLEIEYKAIETIGSVQEVIGLDSDGATITYQDGTVFENPVVFMTAPTYNGWNTATVQISEVTETGVTAFVDEPNYLDRVHVPEDVAMVTFEEGVWSLMDGSKVEVGTTAIGGHELDIFDQISFTADFASAPIVLVQLQTNNGADWAFARTRNITEDGFEVRLQEQENNENWHNQEYWAGSRSKAPMPRVSSTGAMASTGKPSWLRMRSTTRAGRSRSTARWEPTLSSRRSSPPLTGSTPSCCVRQT
ncbi:hypothetical protein AB9K41_05495, partial [Cribrihabitans sp. XS_ASV171]